MVSGETDVISVLLRESQVSAFVEAYPLENLDPRRFGGI